MNTGKMRSVKPDGGPIGAGPIPKGRKMRQATTTSIIVTDPTPQPTCLFGKGGDDGWNGIAMDGIRYAASSRLLNCAWNLHYRRRSITSSGDRRSLGSQQINLKLESYDIVPRGLNSSPN
ncbi:hypothetical protein U1Q18_030790 [Sarracenia purpurea var. burkii]